LEFRGRTSTLSSSYKQFVIIPSSLLIIEPKICDATKETDFGQ